jgi:hypothetical protein
MAQSFRLLPDGMHHIWMRMPERRDRDAGVQVEITFACAVPDATTLASHQDERGLAIVGVQIRLADLHQRCLFVDGHCVWLSAFGSGNKTPQGTVPGC